MAAGRTLVMLVILWSPVAVYRAGWKASSVLFLAMKTRSQIAQFWKVPGPYGHSYALNALLQESSHHFVRE